MLVKRTEIQGGVRCGGSEGERGGIKRERRVNKDLRVREKGREISESVRLFPWQYYHWPLTVCARVTATA